MKKIVSVFLSLCLSAVIMCSCSSPQMKNTEISAPESSSSKISEVSDGEQSSELSEDIGSVSQDSDTQSSTTSDTSKSESTVSKPESSSQNSSKPSDDATAKPSTSNNNNATTKPSTNNNNNTTTKPSTNNNNNTTTKPSTSNNNNATTKPSTNNNNNATTKPSTNNNNNATTKPSTNNNNNTTTKPAYNGNSVAEEKLYQSLFDINSKISIKIDISDSELLKLQQDYDKYKNKGSKSPIYRIASKVTFTINGKDYTIDDVGIRLKGNTSRTDFYNSSKGIYNMTHFRLSFDETFDNSKYYGSESKKWNDADRKARKKRTFATLNGLEIKWNRNYDQTYIREYYTSQMYRENGVLCAKNNISQMNISGDNMGVYIIYEPVDNNFIERNLPKEDWGGDLYKVGWTYNPADYTNNVTYGIEDEDNGKFYNFDLKTNKKTSKHEKLKNLLKVINSPSLTKTQFEKIVDKDYWIKFTAISYFVGNPDDMRNNYNNHYVYFLKSSGKAIFIPYDNDRTLGVTCGYNPTTTGMTTVSPFSTKAEGNRNLQVNPLYKKTVINNGFYISEYTSELKKIANSKWLTMSNFKPIYEIAKAHYNNVTTPDKNYDNADKSRLSFSLSGKYSSGETYNIAIDDYFERILKTFRKYVK